MDPGLSLHGVGARKPAVATLCGLFDHAAASPPDAVAFRHGADTLTWREAGRAAAVLARRLAACVAPGEAVALILPNAVEFPVAYFAALRAGRRRRWQRSAWCHSCSTLGVSAWTSRRSPA